MPSSSFFAKSLLTLSLSLSLSACVIHIDASDGKAPSSKQSLLGNIVIDSHSSVEDISSVNGNLKLLDHVSAEELETVNGDITVGQYSRVESIEVVNGDVTLGEHTRVEEDIEAVNGDLRLQGHNHVGENLVTVNGDIDVYTGVINGHIKTVRGDVRLAGETKVLGDVVFQKVDPKDIGKSSSLLKIEDSVSIEGNIYVRSDVRLEIDNQALRQRVIYQ